MNKIEICPWCGSDDADVEYDGYWTVECGNCGATGKAAETIGLAIANWNLKSRRDWERLRRQRDMMAG